MGRAFLFPHPEELAQVAKTGEYSDLLNPPAIPSRLSELENDSDYVLGSDLVAASNEEIDNILG